MNNNLSRHFKRVIAAAIVLTLVAGAAPVRNFAPLADASITASAEVVSGTFNSTDSWSYDQETKVLTLSGTGTLDLSNYNSEMSNAKAYSAEKIIIEEGFTSIKYIKFSLAKSISIPNTVKSISNRAFEDCYSLESITLPDSVTSLGEDAFYGCTGLKSVHLSDNITTLQNGTFYNCKNLETIYLPKNLTTIASGTYWNRRAAFGGCTSLKSIKLPGTLEAVTGETFKGCTALETVEIEDGVKNIWGSAFSGCTSLKSITIPGSVENVYNSAFNGCTSLAEVNIEEGVKNIGYSAFNGCTALTSIKIPDSVETIDSSAFKDCTALKTVVLPDGLETISGSLFIGCEALETVNIPDGVTSIGYGAFENCTSLESVVIPDSVTEINSEAFENCESLESVTLPKNITELKASVFKDCSSLTSIDIPSGVTSISSDGYSGSGTFSDCTSLKTINFSNTVTEIGSGAFSGCTALETLIIPDNVTELGKSAFADCTGLTSVTLSNSLTTLPTGLFINCTSLESIVIPDGVTTISDSPYYESEGTFKGCTSLKSVTIPDSVTTIGASSFDGCTALKSVAIPANVTTIGYKAFADCSDLTSIDIPNSVEVIEDSAFENCTGIESVVIPASVTEINWEVFNGCTNLKSVEFSGDDGIYFGYDAFGSLTEDVSVEIPKKSKGGMDSVHSDYIYPDNNEGDNADPHWYFGNAKVSFKGGDVTYTKVEAVEPTCTKNGSYEYYIGSDGNYYQDAYGFDKYDSLEDTVWSAYGHSEKVAWSWTKLSSGDYKAVAKFSCKRGDLDITYVTATVTAEESDEGTTYHAVAVCPLDKDMYSWHTSGHEVTYDYFVESAKYTVTVEGGSVTSATKKDEYKSGDSVTVKADKEKDGAFFTGWYIGDKCVSTNPSYTFFVKEDTTITAKYEEQETEQAAVVSLTLTREGASYYSKQKIKYSYGWSLPEGSKLVEAGVLRAYDKDISDVTPDTAKANGVTQNKSSLKTVNGTYNLTVNMSYETKRKTVYSKGYVIYTDAKGNTHTQMTDMQTSAYENN